MFWHDTHFNRDRYTLEYASREDFFFRVPNSIFESKARGFYCLCNTMVECINIGFVSLFLSLSSALYAIYPNTSTLLILCERKTETKKRICLFPSSGINHICIGKQHNTCPVCTQYVLYSNILRSITMLKDRKSSVD